MVDRVFLCYRQLLFSCFSVFEEGAGPALASVERLDCKRMVAWESLQP